MPDYAPNVTPRYKAHYRVVGRAHTAMVRFARGETAVNIQAFGSGLIHNFFLALATLLCDDFTFTGAEYAMTDSDLFFPATLPVAVTGLAPIAAFSKQDSITHLTFSGRGASGSKVNIKAYGCQTGPDRIPADYTNDFLITAAENASVAAAIVVLNTVSNNQRAIDNSIPTFKQQATVKVNDFWLRAVRAGA